MASPLTVGLGVFLAAVVGVQLAFAWKRLRCRTRGPSEDGFEKDVEWQLQHELDDAIEASSKASTPLAEGKDESQPLLSPALRPLAPRVRYGDVDPPPGSYAELRSQYRSDRGQVLLDLLSLHGVKKWPDVVNPQQEQHLKSIDQHSPSSLDSPTSHDSQLYINPKQIQRIVKRRMAREWIEKYFEARRSPVHRPRGRVASH